MSKIIKFPDKKRLAVKSIEDRLNELLVSIKANICELNDLKRRLEQITHIANKNTNKINKIEEIDQP